MSNEDHAGREVPPTALLGLDLAKPRLHNRYVRRSPHVCMHGRWYGFCEYGCWKDFNKRKSPNTSRQMAASDKDH